MACSCQQRRLSKTPNDPTIAFIGSCLCSPSFVSRSDQYASLGNIDDHISMAGVTRRGIVLITSAVVEPPPDPQVYHFHRMVV